MKRIVDWLDARTGCRQLTREALFENIPGGSRWRYVWGSTLTFALFVQFVTGIFLWMAYNPSATTAWESVYYIQYEMAGGWLLRGLHHFTAQAMTILLVLHLMQVVIDGAYRAPREVNFWFGLALLFLVMALSLTGYLLPWDQKGYWATRVTTNLVGITPLIGPYLQKLLVGGADYGHHTLSRFFALHAGVLPALVIALLAGHIYLFRRHGITAKRPFKRKDEKFWPDQVLKDGVACLAVLATVLFFIVKPKLFGEGHLGAELGAPADPADNYSAARPEWYFLFLFQFLKIRGISELVGAIIIPSAVAAFIFVMPFIGQWRLGHRFNVGFLFALVIGAGILTAQAVRQDRGDAVYLAALSEADQNAERIRELASEGIPPSGALALMRSDPYIQGPKLFARHCASCHRYEGHDGLGREPADPASASDLGGFASREWLEGLLDPERIDSAHYFGGTAFSDGKMARYVKRKVAAFDEEEKEQLKKAIIALSAEAKLPRQKVADARDAALIAEGQEHIVDALACIDCHQYQEPDPNATAPDLTGYGSREWLSAFITDPAHVKFYGEKNDRMPSFGADGILTEAEVLLITDWLRGEWYEPPVASLTGSEGASE